MAKWYGEIGYSKTVETKPGYWEEKIYARNYYGDAMNNYYRRQSSGESINRNTFWQLLAYCAGVGGSILIIGSAAGVVVMGLEKITFGWYLRRISWLALAGYLAGIAVYWLEKQLFF